MEGVKTNYIRTENLSQYIIYKDLKQYHPDDPRYVNYWKGLKRRCIEGFWGYETGVHNNGKPGYRFCPGRLFFYGNFCTILDVDEEQNVRTKIRPDIRDLEWEFAYMVLEGEGFSGWSEDDVFTSDIAVHNPDDLNKDKQMKRYLALFNKEGKLKKYKDPRKNIRELKDNPVGVPLYWNNCKNCIILGSRGKQHCPHQ